MYTVAQSGLGGTRTDLGAIMLPTKARVEVVQGGTPQTFKGPEFPSIKKNCTVFFAQIKGELESSPDQWKQMAIRHAGGQLQTVFADGNEVKTTRALFLKNTSGTTSLEELTKAHLKVVHGRVAQERI